MALFIGGPLDGKFIDVEEDKDSVEVAIEHPIPEFPQNTPLNKFTNIFYYKKETLTCVGGNFPIFVPRSYTSKDLILALIEGYHQSALQNET